MPSSSSRSERRSLLELAAGNVLLGTLGIFVIESGQDPVTVVFYRCLVGASALGLYGWWAGWLSLRGMTWRALSLALLTGVLMVGNWVLFTAALARAGISLATIVFHVQPFLVVLLGALVLGERLTLVRLAWVALAFTGLLATIGPEAIRYGFDGVHAVGIVCALGGALCYACVTVIAKRIAGMCAPMLTLVQCLVGVSVLGFLGPVGPGGMELSQAGWLIGMGAIHTGLVYVLVYGALPALATSMIAVLTFLYPASAVLFDALVYGHVVGPGQAVGLALIVTASLGVTHGWRFGVRRPLSS